MERMSGMWEGGYCYMQFVSGRSGWRSHSDWIIVVSLQDAIVLFKGFAKCSDIRKDCKKVPFD